MSVGLVIRRVEPDVLRDLRGRVLGASSAHLRRDGSPSTRHWAAWIGEEVVGCATVNEIRGWMLRGMAVDTARHRMGIGAQLLQRIHHEVAAPMHCNARLVAVPFYAAQGWVSEGPLFPMDDEGMHQRMTWAGPRLATGSLT